MRSSKTHQHLGGKDMGKFKDMITHEMTTNNLSMDSAIKALENAERAVRRASTAQRLDAMWNKSCWDKFTEMNASERGRHFIRKYGSPLNQLNNRPKVRC